MFGLTKNIRKAAACIAVAACIFTISACGEEPEVELEEGSYKTVTQTDAVGMPVTDEEGNYVFQKVPLESRAVTDENGDEMYNEQGVLITEYYDPDEKPPEPVYKVGFVYGDEIEDGATHVSFEAARTQIEKTLGLETCYIENVLVGDFPEAVNVLQDEGCNIIISCSPKFSSSVEKETRSSLTKFINFGGQKTASTSSSFGGELYQTAAVCGMAAAYNTNSNVIGVISDPGEYNVYGIIDGFVLGTLEVLKLSQADVRVNWAWSNDHEEIEAAVDDLIAQGCDVIMSYMESDYPVRYAAQKGVKVIGNCGDLPEVAPDNYITGFYFNFSTYLVDEVRAIVNDNFNPRYYTGDIASGMARLVSFGTAAKEGTESICSKYYDYIKSGQAKVFTGEIKNGDGKIMIEKGQSLDFSNIININWFVQSVRKSGSFTEIIDNPVSSDFVVKK